MPDKETVERAREDAREGKSPSTQAGEFVREEMHHVREGKHGAASTKQAIAIGLSKARRAGVKLQAPRSGKTSAQTTKQAERDYRKGQSNPRQKPSATRSRATSAALKKKGSHCCIAQFPLAAGPDVCEEAQRFGTPRLSRESQPDKKKSKLSFREGFKPVGNFL
jgi:hypothetical protein